MRRLLLRPPAGYWSSPLYDCRRCFKMLATNRLVTTRTFSTFPFLAVATPTPKTQSSLCDTGTVQSCDSVQSAGSATAASILSLSGIAVRAYWPGVFPHHGRVFFVHSESQALIKGCAHRPLVRAALAARLIKLAARMISSVSFHKCVLIKRRVDKSSNSWARFHRLHSHRSESTRSSGPQVTRNI